AVGTIEAVHYAYVVNAVIKASDFTLGQATVGASRITFERGDILSATTARLLLPTSMVNPHIRVTGIELGQNATWRRSERFELHGYGGVDFAAAISPASAFPGLGLTLSAGAQYAFFTWFALALDANGHFGAANETSYLAPALAL